MSTRDERLRQIDELERQGVDPSVVAYLRQEQGVASSVQRDIKPIRSELQRALNRPTPSTSQAPAPSRFATVQPRLSSSIPPRPPTTSAPVSVTTAPIPVAVQPAPAAAQPVAPTSDPPPDDPASRRRAMAEAAERRAAAAKRAAEESQA